MHKEFHPRHPHTCESLSRYAEMLGFGEVHIKYDHATGLRAIIAIHNLNLGPAIGGCRFIHYDSIDSALEDVLRLASMMSYKAAISRLPHGGAKSVILKPKIIKNREAYFDVFGKFVNELNGRYIVAEDSGTTPADMDIIARHTSFVTCTSDAGDPSIYTAIGVRRGIEAAVKFKLKRDSLEGVRIAVQGAGHVGYHLIKELTQHGAKIMVCDPQQELLQRCVNEFKVDTCSPEEIYDVDADIFSPCALGKVLNLETIRRLKVSIVAGSANNQLAHHHHGAVLFEKNILYAPDFVINSGGLIYAAAIYAHGDVKKALVQVNDLYPILLEIFERSKKENLPVNEIAEKMAREKLLMG